MFRSWGTLTGGGLLAALLCAGSLTLAAGPASGADSVSPAEAARTYLRDLNARRWASACALMAPPARRKIGRSCGHALARRFEGAYASDPRWISTRILKLGPVRSELDGNAAVSLRLEVAFLCPRQNHSRRCRPPTRRFKRSDRIFLREDTDGVWRITRGGNVTDDIGFLGPVDREEELFPPTDPTALHQPAAQLAPPDFQCTGPTVASTTDPGGDVEDNDYQAVNNVPWLDIRSVSVSRNGKSACATVELATEPHPDARYSLWWYPTGRGEYQPGGGSIDIFIDGAGVAHALRWSFGTHWQTAEQPPPDFGFIGNRLQVLLNRKSPFDTSRSYALETVSDAEPSFFEPLLPKAIDARDQAPYNACLGYPDGQIVSVYQCNAPSG